MLNHTGLVKLINHIEYHYDKIPKDVTLYPSFLLLDECDSLLSTISENNNNIIQKVLKCISNELEIIIQTDYHKKININHHTYNFITDKQGIPFASLHKINNNPFCILINISEPIIIQFRSTTDNKKYTLTLAKGMMCILYDIDYKYIRNIPYSIDDESKCLLTFLSKK